ncbi:MAG: FecR family protein [Rhodothermales bacterium]
MSSLYDHTNRYRLPPEVLAALEQESEMERAHLLDAWAQADQFLGTEPDDATFRQLGTEIWQNLEAAIQETSPQEETAPVPLRLVRAPLRLVKHRSFRWVAVAACIALLLTVGLPEVTHPSTKVAAAYGDTTHVTLPDGSVVELNSGSTISFASNFGEKTRRVKLKGEAFFRVTRGSLPFVVQTFNGTTTVLGTRFNVRAWTDDRTPETLVTVESGLVRFAERGNDQDGLVLQEGQAARLPRKSSSPTFLPETNVENALAWRTGGFEFPDQPLGTVLNELERRYNLRVNVKAKALLDEPVGLLNKNPLGAEEILREVCEYNQRCEFRAVPGGFEVTQPDAE